MKTYFLILLFITAFFVSCQRDDDIPQPVSMGLQQIAEGFAAPVALVEVPDGSNRLFVVDQTGQIWILNADGSQQQEPFLDLSDKIVELNEGYDERGLLGLAFHPQYQANGRFFVYYSAPLRPDAPSEWNNTSIIAEYTISGNDPNKADPLSERIMMEIDQPQSNHAGATLAFGPDDYLYISLGDGGGAHDTGTGDVEDWYEENEGGNAQNITANLLGKILRIDINSGNPYGIPADNPFVGTEGLDEIYAYGLRNPYRMSFDLAGSRQLFAQDAGQFLWEEVNIITRGGNYGWNVKEGIHCFSTDNPNESRQNCPDTDAFGNQLIDPVIEFANSQQPNGLGTVVVGGYVYRGNAFPQLQGRYLFGVWSKGMNSNEGDVFEAQPVESGLWNFNEINFTGRPNETLGHYLLGFGQSSDGEIHLLITDTSGPTGSTGKVYKLVPVQ